SRAVRADKADAVATLNADREIAHDWIGAKTLADPLRLHDEPAGQFLLADGDFHGALRAAIVAEALAQVGELAHAAHVAQAPRSALHRLKAVRALPSRSSQAAPTDSARGADRRRVRAPPPQSRARWRGR